MGAFIGILFRNPIVREALAVLVLQVVVTAARAGEQKK